MDRFTIIDSHVHLWPQEMANEASHSWMTPGMPLVKPHLIENYDRASQPDDISHADAVVQGIVYVETDVRYDEPHGDLSIWARGPLDEIKFLRSIVEGKYGERDSDLLKGIVPWAPVDQPLRVLERWLELGKETAGAKTWARVKGFRFLLQAIVDQAQFELLVFSDSFVANMKLLGRKGFAFDIGVDQHSGGVWQLEAIHKAMELAHAGVAEEDKATFVLNHLCKPDFSETRPDFDRWCKAIAASAELSKTYIKLSGAFSELPTELQSASDIAAYMHPWLEHVFRCFRPSRIMFGTDWPVCNVRGFRGDGSWTEWKNVVALILNDERYKLSDYDRQQIWKGTAKEAYQLG